MAAARVILVSDTHLSAAAPQAQANWDVVVSYVGACPPDLVIHLGDLSLDGAGNAADLGHGRAQLDRLPVAWHAVPGNHDIGDNPFPDAPGGSTVTADRLQRWLGVVGADHWSPDSRRLVPARDQRATHRIRAGGRGAAVGVARAAGQRLWRERASARHA